MTARSIERWWPLAAALVVVGLWAWLGRMTFPQQIEGLLAAACTVAAVIVGFLATAKALVLGFSNTRAFRALKEHGYNQDLISCLFLGMISGTLFLVVSLSGFFVVAPGESVPSWFTVVWMFAGAWTLFQYVQVAGFLFKLLRGV